MSVSPCCDLPRGHCETCPVYARAVRELSLADRAMIRLADGTTIEGEVHKLRGQRMSDTFNEPGRSHVAVTSATVTYPEGSNRPPEEHRTLLVAKHSCLLIAPLVEHQEGRAGPACEPAG